MSNHHVGGAPAPSLLRSLAVPGLFLLSGLLGSGVSAQAPGGVPTPPTTPAANAPIYGRIVVDEAPLRCWASAVAAPPVFEDLLVKDQIVRLGRTDNGFRAVELPLGPIGYVSQRFASEDEHGVVRTNGSKVAFRYRPRTSEAPVAQLAEGTELHVVAVEEGWYKARVSGIDAWVANAEVEVVASDPEVVAAYEKLEGTMKAAVQERLDRIAAEQRRKEQDRIDMAAIEVVESAFRQEQQKPIADQQIAPIEKALAKAVEGLADDSAARVAAQTLAKAIETHRWIVDATEITETEPPPVPSNDEPEQPKDRLTRFEAIGWLRYEARIGQPGVYYLEKGARRLYLLTCNTGRFDLSMFVGCEVGVIGPRRMPLGATISTLDVERLEVLANASN